MGHIDEEDRPGFIRKVYGILTTQLTFTALFCGFCVIKSQKNDIAWLEFMTSPPIWGSVIGAYIFTICTLLVCRLEKFVPWNYILLSIFTFCVSWLVGVACVAVRDPLVVLMAACMTAAMVYGLTIYAIRTKTDFTMLGAGLYVASSVLMTASFFTYIFGGPCRSVGISLAGVILFSIYLIHDTQMIVGGQHRNHQFDKDSYILAAIVLYIDII